jgi:hypothetical protein
MLRRLRLIICLIGFVTLAHAQESETPFKKGLWMTGLDGIISSASNALDTVNRSNFNTSYALNIASHKFLQDKWAAGLRLTASRSSSVGIVERQSESIFIGPSLMHFFSDSKDGSLFIELSPGYVRFFEKSESTSTSLPFSESIDGNGFGLTGRFGYAHVIDEKIVFNFGMNVTSFWILADRNSEPSGLSKKENLRIGSLAFNFGFSVLLEKFFF